MDDDGVACASANGLLHCLRFLAQEAASLNLLHTLSAIEGALETALFESGGDPLRDGQHHACSMALLH